VWSLQKLGQISDVVVVGGLQFFRGKPMGCKKTQKVKLIKLIAVNNKIEILQYSLVKNTSLFFISNANYLLCEIRS